MVIVHDIIHSCSPYTEDSDAPDLIGGLEKDNCCHKVCKNHGLILIFGAARWFCISMKMSVHVLYTVYLERRTISCRRVIRNTHFHVLLNI